MHTNKELLSKADLALADLASGGKLNPEQAQRFVRKLIKSPTILRDARVVTLRSDKQNIDKIGFGSRILRKAVSATALDVNQRAKPTFEQIVVDTDEVIAEVRIPYDVMEDNIEQAAAATNAAPNARPGGLHATIVDLIAERVATDLEELALDGDTGSGDAYLAMRNGWLKIAEDHGNVVDWQGAAIEKGLFKAGKKAMPDQYLRNIAAMRHFVSMDQETDYRDTLADRGTAMGDAMIQGRGPVFAFGTPISPVSLMRNTHGLFTDPRNLIFGIHRQISMEFDKIITERVYVIVVTARVGFQIEEREAVVLYKNIG